MTLLLYLFIIPVIPILLIVTIIISFLIKIDSKGPIIHWSKRIGKNEKIFLMPKFRTMHISTPQVATHLFKDQKMHITKLGSFLRKYSLDELPQLYSILVGDMTFIGPRPALFNQQDLIILRRKNNLNIVKPGITGWAQVNGRDTISIDEKVRLELEYNKKKGIFIDIKIVMMTILKVITKSDINH